METVAALLEPYETRAIARAISAPTYVASKIKRGHQLPDVAHLPALADLLRMDLAAFTRLVADERNRRKEAAHEG